MCLVIFVINLVITHSQQMISTGKLIWFFFLSTITQLKKKYYNSVSVKKEAVLSTVLKESSSSKFCKRFININI